MNKEQRLKERTRLKEYSKEELAELQQIIRNIKDERFGKKGIHFGSYIPLRYQKALPLVIDYLVHRKILQKPSLYALGSLAVSTLIEQALTDMEAAKRQEMERQRQILNGGIRAKSS